MGQGQLRVITLAKLIILKYRMLHTKFQAYKPTGSGEEAFEGFYHIWALQPSWPCEQDHLNKLSFLLCLEHMKIHSNTPKGFRGEVL